MPLPRATIVCLATTFLLVACATEQLPTAASPTQATPTSTGPDRPTPLNPFLLARVPTYEHSMQAVHPDVVRFAQPWNGWEYWMAFTPFPGGQSAFENPSIVVSHNGINWYVPSGVTNPLVPATSAGYNSDPDLSFDQGRGELVLIYRTVAADHNNVLELRSADGIAWGKPLSLFRRRHPRLVSPAMVIMPAGGAQVWYVDAGSSSCQDRVTRVMTQVATSANSLRQPVVGRGWTSPRQVMLVQPGYNIWHIDVSWIAARNEYWAVYSAYSSTHCMSQDLFFARSADGLTWQTYAVPVISRGDFPWTSGSLYRSTVLYDEVHDAIQFYTSSRSRSQEWRIGFVEYPLSTFLTALSYGVVSTATMLGQTWDPSVDIEP